MATKKKSTSKNAKTYSIAINVEAIKKPIIEQWQTFKKMASWFCKVPIPFILYGFRKDVYEKQDAEDYYLYCKTTNSLVYILAILFGPSWLCWLIGVRVVELMLMDF